MLAQGRVEHQIPQQRGLEQIRGLDFRKTD
jgi:hypothetical protein